MFRQMNAIEVGPHTDWGCHRHGASIQFDCKESFHTDWSTWCRCRVHGASMKFDCKESFYTDWCRAGLHRFRQMNAIEVEPHTDWGCHRHGVPGAGAGAGLVYTGCHQYS